MKELIELNTDIEDHVSAVLDGTMPIIGNNTDEVMGNIGYKIRMRKPIT